MSHWHKKVVVTQNIIMYFNYHARAKRLILDKQLTGYEFLDNYHGISPALVLYFKDRSPMPIRSYRWEEYIDFIMAFEEEKRG